MSESKTQTIREAFKAVMDQIEGRDICRKNWEAIFDPNTSHNLRRQYVNCVHFHYWDECPHPTCREKFEEWLQNPNGN